MYAVSVDPVALRSSQAAKFATSRSLHQRIRAQSLSDVNSARRRSGGVLGLPDAEVQDNVVSAATLGYYLAFIYRFFEERHPALDRKALFPATRNRDEDFSRTREAYPEIDAFIPTTPLTEDEVLAAAVEEMRAMTKGRGSNAHQAKLYGAFKFSQTYRTMTTGPSEQRTFGNPEALRGGTIHFSQSGGAAFLTETRIDFQEHDVPAGTMTARATPFASSGATEISPLMVAAASHLLPRYGLTMTTYWWLEKECYPGEYAVMLRVMGADESDPAAFKAACVDLARKLKAMDLDLKESLQGDVEFRVAHEAMLN